MSGRKTIDWYERQLETNPNLTPQQIEEYEAEVERLADLEAQVHNKIEERKREEKLRKAQMKAEILAGNKSAAIAQGLAEFGDDYEIRKEGNDYVVYSKVAADHQEHRRVHKSLSDAESDLDYLIYNRMYDKYVRTQEYDSLRQME